MNETEILVISDTKDFTSDYVCMELEKRGKDYLRLDRDRFATYKVDFNVTDMTLGIVRNNSTFHISSGSLKSVYYRAPTYLRETFARARSPQEQLYASQWMSFIRNLSVFENALWMNNPSDTFRSENKLLQLSRAKQIGLEVPLTRIVNFWRPDFSFGRGDKRLIAKSIDTVLLKVGDKEGFAYSNIVEEDELSESDLSISPVMLQDYVYPKVDLRVTVVGSKVFSVEIRKDGQGVGGDWRKLKGQVEFIPVSLPQDISCKCVELVKGLGLKFGGVDLVFSNGRYFFIEVNPTGEWAWLVDSSNLPIHEAICDVLDG